MQKLITYLWIVLVCIVTLLLESPTKVASVDSDSFSAISTESHIRKMASEVHFMGTSENKKVRDYILTEFEKMDIQTELFVGNTDRNYNNRYIKLARTENIIATIKGSGGSTNNKAVLITGHYDSVLSGPGAADDVHAVACMLETARLLKNSQYKNDIIFLITDGEEMGLFGAKSFVEQKDISNIGLVLNYEARGNSGPSIAFEWSEGNAWLVKQVQKVGRRPIANSLSYEIYNLLPNDTDFTFFKKAGLPGINHAFIDGFSYYHNPDDSPEKLNMKSVQHTGENMFNLVDHFGNLDLSTVVSYNASFFNFFSSLIIYPSSWDLILLLLTVFLVFFVIYMTFKTNEIKIKSTILAFLNLIFVFIFMCVGMKLLSTMLFKVYPQYDVFYAGQFYNHKIYILTIVGASIFVMWLRTYFYNKNHDFINLKIVSLILLFCMTIGFYFFLPTATYFICLPISALAVAMLLNESSFKFKSTYKFILSMILILIPLGIWVPVINTLFLAFSLSNMMGPAVLLCVICLGLIITFENMWKEERVLPIASLILFFGSIIWAHMTSQPTDEKPLPSSLIYHYDVDADLSHWLSNDTKVNIGNQAYFSEEGKVEVRIPFNSTKLGALNNVKPAVETTIIDADTTDNFNFKMRYTQEVFQTRVYVEDTENIKSISINSQLAFEKGKEDKRLTIEVFGLTQDSLQIHVLKFDESKKVKVSISSRFLGLPIKDVLPDNAVRQDGYSSLVRSVEI